MTSYLVEYLIVAPHTSAAAFRTWLIKSVPWARELLVEGDEEIIRVHLRTGRPDLALGAGIECGVVQDIVIETDTTPVGTRSEQLARRER